MNPKHQPTGIGHYLGHTVLLDGLCHGGIVLDCGSNYGAFARWVAERFGARVFGFEPDPRLFQKLPSIPGVKFFPLAVSGVPGKKC